MPIEFDAICIFMAVCVFFAKARERFRSISYFVMCFFVISEAVYQRVLLDVRLADGNGWVIFQLYSAINCFLIYKLYKCNAHLFPIAILTLNVLLNIVVSYYFVSDSVPKLVYNNYEYPAAVIMALCLFYMWTLTNGNRLLDRLSCNTGFVGVLFRPCGRLV